MTKLKPCPFCGGEAYIAHRRDERFWNYYCGCVDCGVETLGHDRKKEAIEAWNRRPSPWHTGTPTEEGWYLVQYEDIDKTFFVAWSLERFGEELRPRMPQGTVAWQRIEPLQEYDT